MMLVLVACVAGNYNYHSHAQETKPDPHTSPTDPHACVCISFSPACHCDTQGVPVPCSTRLDLGPTQMHDLLRRVTGFGVS
jgi:hypothetical protein